MKSEFIIAIKQLSTEKGLPQETVIEAVEQALASAYKKELDTDAPVLVRIDQATGAIQAYIQKLVVDEVENPDTEISLTEARHLVGRAFVGDSVPIAAQPENAGRIAAQTAKQVVLQKLREAEREAVYDEFAGKEGDIVSGMIQRVEEHRRVVIDLGRTEAEMPAAEMVRAERYRPGQRIKVYVLRVEKSGKGPQVAVSRAHKNLLRRLFELEVPEIYRGTVEIKSIAREPGYRSKVSVAGRQAGVDPVGACVGMRGIRIQNIVNELGGERVDVIQWDADPARFVANALSPAEVLSVTIDEATRTATVIVPDRQLSLAIGKEGQNARLAAKLSGWRIDIKSQSLVQKTEPTVPLDVPTQIVAEPEPEALQQPVAPAPEPVGPDAEPIAAEAPAEEERAEEAEVIPVAELLRTTEEERPRTLRFAEEVLPTVEGDGKKKRKAKDERIETETEVARAAKKAKRPKRAAAEPEEEDDEFSYLLPR